MKDYAAAQWERARQSLRSAAQLVESDPNSAASRAYYAAFHGLSAFFALRGQSFSKHTALRGALHRDLVAGGSLGTESGKDFDFLLELRETGDYGGVADVASHDARSAVERAARLLRALAGLCPELGPVEGSGTSGTTSPSTPSP
jgi:uncharacterized protein (UPF0332 family)